jgi:hypothetical protein
MQIHSYFHPLSIHSEIRGQITHGLLTISPIVQETEEFLRIVHPLAGITILEKIEGEPAKSNHPLIQEPRLTKHCTGFPVKPITHGAFALKPLAVLNDTRLSTLLSQIPSHFDNFSLGGFLVRAIEFKSSKNIRMPLELWKAGFEHGLNRILQERLLEQLFGCSEEPAALELSPKPTEPETLRTASIKSKFLSNFVA